MSGAQRIRELVSERAILMPGVYDALTRPDRRAGRLRRRLHLGLLGQRRAARRARLRLPDPDRDGRRGALGVPRLRRPVIVDADTGYGNPLNVIRTVRDLHDAGAAGVFLEDQVWPKKCGHMAGKRGGPDRGPRREAARRRRRARRARPLHRRPHRRPPPLGLDEAIERGLAYARRAPTRSSSRRRSRSRSWSGSPTRCPARWSPT